MKAVLDTCAVSEIVKEQRDPGFEAWLAEQSHDQLSVAAATVTEMLSGAFRLPEGRRRSALLAKIEGYFATLEILPYDGAAAALAAQMIAAEVADGRVLKFADASIAAVALANDRALVTRDADFDGLSAHGAFKAFRLVNPWRGG